jgi:hypothetical protein
VTVVVPGPTKVRRPVVDTVATSGFEFCQAAILVRSRPVSSTRSVAIIWIIPGGARPIIVTEMDEIVGDGAVGDGAIDWPQA